MKCPVCQKKFADIPEKCPRCQADLSLSVLINNFLGKLNSEAEELLKQNPYNKNVRMMLQVWRRLNGKPDNLEELNKMHYSFRQKVFFLWSEYKLSVIGAMIGIITIGLIGFVSLQNNIYTHRDQETKNVPTLSDETLSPSKLRTTNENPSRTYIFVRKGDSLWKLSMEIYHSESYIQKIASENGHDPQKPIFPGQKLVMPGDAQR